MITRRKFLAQSSLAAAALLVAPNLAFSKKNAEIGLQMYTLRDDLIKNFKGTIENIAKAGYNSLETFGFSAKNQYFGYKTEDFKRLLDANKLVSPSGHYMLGSYFKDGNMDELKASIAASKILKHEYLVVPWFEPALRNTKTDYEKLVDKINVAAKHCRDAGLRLAYHNHDFEFADLGGTTGYDMFLSGLDKNLVDFEMDLYWVVFAGKDPLKMFKENPGRFVMWHVKDMDKTDRKLNAEVGTGSIDFKSIFAQAKLSGMKHFYVEHETNYKPNPLASVGASCAYIKANLV